MTTLFVPGAWQREYFSQGYKIAFLNAIDLRLCAAESPGRALRAVIQAEANPAKRRDMAPALEALEQGESVSVALAQLKFFDSTVMAILGAGERSGMSDAIHAATLHLGVKQAWLRQHALVIFLLANELFSAVMAPVVLHTEILPWMRKNISEPVAPQALMAYHRDMNIAEHLTLLLLIVNGLLLVFGVINIYRISRLKAPAGVLLFFSDSAMAVGFKLAAAMLRAGVTIEAVANDLAKQAPGWARRYWSAVHAQLDLAIEPAHALIQQGVYQEERSLLASHSNARQLADTYSVLANGRDYRAKRARDFLLTGATLLTVAYVVMTLAVAAWIYMTYDATIGAGLDALQAGF
jgi:type II secretory pathway component PulF